MLPLALWVLVGPVYGASPVKIGISANPCDCDDNEAYGTPEYDTSYALAIQNGADFISLSKDWDDLETSEASYALSEVQRVLTAANTHGAHVQLTLVVVSFDGSSKVPAYLSGVAFDHASMSTAINGLIDAIHALTGSSRIRVVLLGNEVEGYFGVNPSHITPYASLLTSAKTHIRGKANWSDVHVTASFKHDDAADYTTTYAAIAAADTIAAFTYYPINGDFTVEHTNTGTMAADVFSDLNGIYTATGGAQMLLSEVGFPSAGSLNSSEALQSAFAAAIGTNAQLIGPALLDSVNFEWLTNLPEWVIDLLGYPDPLATFVSTLGYRDESDVAKGSWAGLVQAMRDPWAVRLRTGA